MPFTDGEHEHGGDGRIEMDMPRPAEDDYEDGLQDMDMMPGDMGMGGMANQCDSNPQRPIRLRQQTHLLPAQPV